MSRYEDIINLPHHVSKNRRPMPMENRAAQFAPFAALVGILQTTQVDSAVCDMNAYPYRARAYATQKIVRESTVTERSLVTTCTLIDAVRSDANPQGFLIGNLTVVENKDLRIYDR